MRSGCECRAAERQRIFDVNLDGDQKKPERESGVERGEIGLCRAIEGVGRERLSLPRRSGNGESLQSSKRPY